MICDLKISNFRFQIRENLSIKDSIMAETYLLEQLESRTLLSTITLKGRELIVRGETGTANNISVGFDGRQKNIILTLNGVQSQYRTGSINLIDLIGGAGNDFLHVDETLAPFSIRTRMYGVGGDNTLVGGTERDYMICGGAGNDTIITGAGDDIVVGGTGNDTISLGKDFKLVYGSKGNNTITAATRIARSPSICLMVGQAIVILVSPSGMVETPRL